MYAPRSPRRQPALAMLKLCFYYVKLCFYYVNSVLKPQLTDHSPQLTAHSSNLTALVPMAVSWWQLGSVSCVPLAHSSQLTAQLTAHLVGGSWGQ